MRIFDAHCDIFTDIIQKRDIGIKNVLPKHIDNFKKGNVFGSIFVVWTEEEYSFSQKRSLDILKAGVEEIKLCSKDMTITKSYKEILSAIDEGKIFAILGLEGISFIKDKIDYIYDLYNLGIRHISLTWNEENLLATGALGSKDRGVTRLGIEAINIIESLGIILDVSHLNEKSFWDVYKYAKKPFIASHSNVYNLCKNGRNLKDDQIKAIKDVGGVIGINAWPSFVDEKNACIEKVVDHIEYVIDLIGLDYVGLGFDFCEFKSPKEILISNFYDHSYSQSIIDILRKRGHKDDEIRKIAYQNFLRVLKEILV
ncbi:membrane dipeptidase [Alkalithermobacter thermoalcaliphilus JW-YL-7 = DSM 7308]|uniref:Membrane dipeptidase n=1 Tax=Alkalithermobacter thermoalcaliphilus JW-YL-7 = DSM 7308 TaxID=1121328 RepID=A0A150FSF9_CLOPD|nr:Membrane dipeptidase [[Clostridium] paradoxum JW-YL-7 = DSM 7308]SHK70757.1 membrane dipeptidase [[Clostridium] paradoxum JW-YL-7 = DSM 7308]